MLKVVVLVSGGGTNLQALIDFEKQGNLKSGKIVKVISNKSDAYALERAKKAGIPSAVVNRKSYGSKAEYDKAMAGFAAMFKSLSKKGG